MQRQETQEIFLQRCAAHAINRKSNLLPMVARIQSEAIVEWLLQERRPVNSRKDLEYKPSKALRQPSPLRNGDMIINSTDTIYAMALAANDAGNPRAFVAINKM